MCSRVIVASLLLILLLFTSSSLSLVVLTRCDAEANILATVIVDEGDAIQSAIDNAEHVDTILVQPGIYVECLTIKLSLAKTGKSFIL